MDGVVVGSARRALQQVGLDAGDLECFLLCGGGGEACAERGQRRGAGEELSTVHWAPPYAILAKLARDVAPETRS